MRLRRVMYQRAVAAKRKLLLATFSRSSVEQLLVHSSPHTTGASARVLDGKYRGSEKPLVFFMSTYFNVTLLIIHITHPLMNIAFLTL